MKKALTAVAVFCTLAFAQSALAANTATISVSHNPMVLGGSKSTTIHVGIPQSTDPIAAINIFVPSGYTLTTNAAAGTKIGTVDATAFSRDANLTLPLSGDVTVDSPASHTSDSTQCAGTPASTAVWILNLSVAGQSIKLPLYVNPTSGAQAALGAYRLTICLPPPDVPVGTPGRSAQGAQVLDARFTVDGIFTTPSTAGIRAWESLFTPYNPGKGTVNAAGTFEARALVGVPGIVTLGKSYVARTNTFKATGTVTEGGSAVAGVSVRIARGTALARLTQSASVTTGSTGAFSLTGKLSPKKTTYLRAFVTVGERSSATGCANPLPPSVAPAGCVSATLSPWAAQSALVKITVAKKKK